MAEMTEARKAAWKAEEDRKAQARRDREAKALREKRAKAKAASPLADVHSVSEQIRETRWITAVLAGVNQNQAARDAGYADRSPMSISNTVQNLKKKFAREIAASILDRDTLIARIHQQAEGPGDYFEFQGPDKKFDWPTTYDNMVENDAKRLIVGVKKTKYGEEVIFKNTDIATKIIAEVAGLTSAAKVDVSVILQGKTEEEKQAIRDGAVQKLLEAKQREAAVEGEYTDDFSRPDAY